MGSMLLAMALRTQHGTVFALSLVVTEPFTSNTGEQSNATSLWNTVAIWGIGLFRPHPGESYPMAGPGRGRACVHWLGPPGACCSGSSARGGAAGTCGGTSATGDCAAAIRGRC